MQKQFKLKGLVPTDQDVEIAQWNKKVGEDFQADEVLLEVLADKAATEVSACEPGRLVSILHSDGEVVSLDDPIAVIEVGD